MMLRFLVEAFPDVQPSPGCQIPADAQPATVAAVVVPPEIFGAPLNMDQFHGMLAQAIGSVLAKCQSMKAPAGPKLVVAGPGQMPPAGGM